MHGARLVDFGGIAARPIYHFPYSLFKSQCSNSEPWGEMTAGRHAGIMTGQVEVTASRVRSSDVIILKFEELNW